MGWPQIVVAAWLVLSITASFATVMPGGPRRTLIVLSPFHQRIAAAGFGLAALSEASLLWAGGFFKGII